MRAEALASGGVEAAHMTIGKKLYLGFGAVLAIMLVLFIINIFTVRREYIARSTVASTLSDVKAIETVRFQMMETRLYLGNYLLSGDVRDEDKTNKGANELSEILKDAESKVNDANLKTAFVQVDEGERSWLEDFAKPMIAKRHQVDAGDATVFSTIPIPGLTNPQRYWMRPICPCARRWTIPTHRPPPPPH
jgi:CHASE3 domain sensor protein